MVASVRNWWAEHSQTFCRLGEVFLAFTSGVLTLVSFGSPFWIENDPNEDIDHQGLWQQCTGTPVSKCISLQNTPGAVTATRAMMSLALVSGLLAWIVSIGALLVHKPKILFPAAVAYGLQVFWLFIGLLVYVAEFQAHKGADRGWAYTIGWLALLFSLGCCLYFTVVAWYRLKHPSSNTPKLQQIYAPLTQMEDDYTDSDDNDDDNL